MTDEPEKLLQAFGKAMVARDHEALDVILAPWIGVSGAIAMVEAASIDRKADFRGASQNVSYDSIGDMAEHIPLQVTEANYAGWHSIAFTASTGADAGRLNLVFAAVELADGLHVGSLAKAQS